MNALDQIKDISIRDDLYPGELRNDAGPCPFPGHGKQTGQSPPFKFFAKDNGFKCFGCGARGSAIDFWMALKGLIFPEAVRDLAERHRIELEPWTPEQEARVIVQRRREDAINWMATYHEQQLTEGTPEWEYLVSRGFTADVIREYHLGVDNKTMLGTIRRHPDILTAVGLTEQDLVDAGGVYENAQTKKRRSFLGGRITFPITKRGRVVGISGRAGPVPPDVSPLDPKYLNLKGIPLSTLFLEDSIRNEADVCEGLPDTLTLAMMNFPACGQQGTSGMDSHAHKFKSCQRVYTWFDTDDAGQRATARVGQAIHDQLKRGEVRVCLLPAPFKDVNEAYLAGWRADDFKKVRAKAPALVAWMIDRIPKDLAPVDQEREIGVVLELLLPLGPLQRGPYLNALRDRLKVRVSDLREMIRRLEGAVAADAAGDVTSAGAILRFTANRERIPAQCYTFATAAVPAIGNLCAYLPIMRQTPGEDGRMHENERWEAVLITATHTPDGGMNVRAEPCDDLPLSEGEQRRIPFEATARGRWRIEGRCPHSVERFIKGEVPKVNGWTLFSGIMSKYMRFIWFPRPVGTHLSADYDLLAVWTMQSYVFQLFDAVGYLHLTGTRESGKSNIARLLEELCFNSSKSSNQTGPVLFRTNEANCGTRIMEEAERLNAPKVGTPDYDLMLMCNDGYKRGAKAERMDETIGKGGRKKLTAVAFDLYSPKVLVSINDLNHVLASRCIAIACMRARAQDLDEGGIKDLSQSMHWERPNLAELRDQAHCWALQSFGEVFAAYQALLDDPSLDHLRGREREMWLPLLAIALYLDNQNALSEAGGDAVIAERLLLDWDAKGETIQHRLIEMQKVKESDRRISESDQSTEMAVLSSVYRLLVTDEFSSTASDLTLGPLYQINNLAKVVTEELVDSGLLKEGWTIAGRRLTAILMKTGAAAKGERQDHQFRDFDGRKKLQRCLALKVASIEAALVRLGGKLPDATA